LTPLDGNANGVLAVKEPNVREAKYGHDDDDIKQVAANSSKSVGLSLSSRPSIRAATPLTLSDFFVRGAEIVTASAINWTAFCELLVWTHDIGSSRLQRACLKIRRESTRCYNTDR
jgi:hypothetical protein